MKKSLLMLSAFSLLGVSSAAVASKEMKELYHRMELLKLGVDLSAGNDAGRQSEDKSPAEDRGADNELSFAGGQAQPEQQRGEPASRTVEKQPAEAPRVTTSNAQKREAEGGVSNVDWDKIQEAVTTKPNILKLKRQYKEVFKQLGEAFERGEIEESQFTPELQAIYKRAVGVRAIPEYGALEKRANSLAAPAAQTLSALHTEAPKSESNVDWDKIQEAVTTKPNILKLRKQYGEVFKQLGEAFEHGEIEESEFTPELQTIYKRALGARAIPAYNSK